VIKLKEEDVIQILRRRYQDNDTYQGEIMIANIASDFSHYYELNNKSFDRHKFWDAIFNE